MARASGPCDHGVLLRRGCHGGRPDIDGGRVAAGHERAVRQQVRDVPDGMHHAAAAGQRWQWLLLAVASALCDDSAISTGRAAAAGQGREAQRLLLLLHRWERPELRRLERSLHATAPGASSHRRCLGCSLGEDPAATRSAPTCGLD